MKAAKGNTDSEMATMVMMMRQALDEINRFLSTWIQFSGFGWFGVCVLHHFRIQ